MKIEKGKLYLYNGNIERPMSDMEVDDGLFSNKIAVHCPTKEDWDYIESHGYDIHPFYEMYVHSLYDHSIGDFDQAKKNGYKVLLIEEFKKFYPEDENWEEKAKKEALNSVEELASNGVKESLNILGDKSGLISNINPSHYSTLSIQPIDYIEANKLDFNEGNVIKYVATYKKNNGLEDLKKARYHIDRLIEINSK